MSDTQMEQLRAIRATLEQISVCGRANMDRMLGCIITLDKIINQNDAKEMTPNDH